MAKHGHGTVARTGHGPWSSKTTGSWPKSTRAVVKQDHGSEANTSPRSVAMYGHGAVATSTTRSVLILEISHGTEMATVRGHGHGSVDEAVRSSSGHDTSWCWDVECGIGHGGAPRDHGGSVVEPKQRL